MEHIDKVEYINNIDYIKTSDDIKKFIEYIEDIENVLNSLNLSMYARWKAQDELVFQHLDGARTARRNPWPHWHTMVAEILTLNYWHKNIPIIIITVV